MSKPKSGNPNNLPEVQVTVDAETAYTGLIVANDPDIGISVANKDDHDDYLLCLRSALVLKQYDDINQQKYTMLYNFTNECINSGILDYSMLIEFSNKEAKERVGDDAGTNSCAFNQ